MAMKINAGDEVRRGDVFFIDPFQVIVNEESRGRHKPPTEEEIIRMAKSLYVHGQQTPVECRRVEENKLELNLGFTRTAAARLLREGFEDGGVKFKDENFMLKVLVCDSNPEVAFIHNIVENAHRNQTSPVDDALNQQKLRDRYGYSDTQITELYQYNDPTKVGRLKKLLSLDQAVLNQVHDETMPVAAALALLDLPETDRKEAVKAATNNKGKVSGSAIKKHIREKVLNDNGRDRSEIGSNGTTTVAEKASKPSANSKSHHDEPKGVKPLTVAEVRKFWADVAEEVKEEKAQHFLSTINAWLQGKRTDKKMMETFEKLITA